MTDQYDRIGQQYAETKRAVFANVEDPARVFIRKWLTNVEGKILLDAGCGRGDDVVFYETMGFCGVFGFDISAASVREAKTKSRDPNNIWINSFESIGVAPGLIDIVTSRYALHYLVTFDKAYAEVARVLKHNGLFILSVDHPTSSMVCGEKFMLDGVKYVRNMYGGTLPFEFPYHNFGDYLSPTFFKHFELLEVGEAIGPELAHQDGPNALFFAARKR